MIIARMGINTSPHDTDSAQQHTVRCKPAATSSHCHSTVRQHSHHTQLTTTMHTHSAYALSISYMSISRFIQCFLMANRLVVLAAAAADSSSSSNSGALLAHTYVVYKQTYIV